jgi:hypothetical protein
MWYNVVAEVVIKYCNKKFIEDNTLQPILAKPNDLFTEEPIKTNKSCNLFINEPVEKNTNDMLVKEPRILITMQSNDVLVNLITGVTLVKPFCPKSYVTFQEPPTLTLWLQYKGPMQLFLHLFIFSLLSFLYFLFFLNEEMNM